MFDASSGIFLIFKLLSESYTLQEMFTVLTMGSVIVHLRTFFLMPFHSVPEDTNQYSLFRSSFVGRCFVKDTVDQSENKVKEDVPAEVTADSQSTVGW